MKIAVGRKYLVRSVRSTGTPKDTPVVVERMAENEVIARSLINGKRFRFLNVRRFKGEYKDYGVLHSGGNG